jgi:hypothetical protein
VPDAARCAPTRRTATRLVPHGPRKACLGTRPVRVLRVGAHRRPERCAGRPATGAARREVSKRRRRTRCGRTPTTARHERTVPRRTQLGCTTQRWRRTRCGRTLTTDTRKGRARRTRPRPLLLNRGLSFEQFRDQGRDGRAFGAGQGDVAEERVSFQGFDDGGDPVMAADAEVVALGDVVGEDNL